MPPSLQAVVQAKPSDSSTHRSFGPPQSSSPWHGAHGPWPATRHSLVIESQYCPFGQGASAAQRWAGWMHACVVASQRWPAGQSSAVRHRPAGTRQRPALMSQVPGPQSASRTHSAGAASRVTRGRAASGSGLAGGGSAQAHRSVSAVTMTSEIPRRGPVTCIIRPRLYRTFSRVGYLDIHATPRASSRHAPF
jgi:hypothetical protein